MSEMKNFKCAGYIEDHEGIVMLYVDSDELFIEAFDHDTLDDVSLHLPDEAAIKMRDWLTNYIERYTA